MLSLPIQPGLAFRPLRHWKTYAPAEAVRLISDGATVAVGWISDALAQAVATGFQQDWRPRDLTIVYAATQGLDRIHGLNRLAVPGLVRRVIGGQWYPVPALHAMARSNEIEAYSLPAGLIIRLFRDIGSGLPNHITRAGLGTLADPRHGGGRLNSRTRDSIVELVQAPTGGAALMIPTFPIDVAIVGVSFLADTGAILMTREAVTIARAARKSGGMVIAQAERIGTQQRARSDQAEVAEDLIDVLVTGSETADAADAFAGSRTANGFGALAVP